MPHIDFALLAESSEERGGPMDITKANANVFVTSGFPVHLTFDVIWRITATWNECGKTYELILDAADEDDRLLFPSVGQSITPVATRFTMPGGIVNKLFVATFKGLPITKPGSYQVILRMKGSPTVREPFFVFDQAKVGVAGGA